MKNVYAVLLLKETEVLRVRREIAALRLVIPLLLEGVNQESPVLRAAPARVPPRNKWPLDIREAP